MADIEWKLDDPYVYQTLSGIVGAQVAVQTTKFSVRGTLKLVMPDHIVVHMGGNDFYIRTKEIIWVVPNPSLIME
ncbi:YuzF family protein [Peribacillus sp. SCS-155]|uniref:YuzF family protein n=1 Tax=Peribacillus sedimenti TaxID=3115297 RepID=UPI0039067808